VAAGHSGGNGGVFPGRSSSRADGRVRQRANSSSIALGRQCTTTAPCGSSEQRTTTTSYGGGGQHVPCPRVPRAPPTQTPSSSAPFNTNEEMEHDVEELGSSGGPPMSHANQAQWNDANNACLLELCIDQHSRNI